MADSLRTRVRQLLADTEEALKELDRLLGDPIMAPSNRHYYKGKRETAQWLKRELGRMLRDTEKASAKKG